MILYGTGQTVCAGIIIIFNKKMHFKKQWSPRRLENDKYYERENFFKSGRNCDLENYSLGSLVLVPRKTLEEIAFKEQQKLFEI